MKKASLKKISFVGNARHLGRLLVVMQGVMLILAAIFFLNGRYMNTWRDYPAAGSNTAVYLKDIGEEKLQEVLEYLIDAADRQQLFIVRRDLALKNDGTPSGYKIGVYGSTAENDVDLSFMDQPVLTKDNLNRLLTSEKENGTLGIETGSVDSLGAIPSFRFYDQVVVKKLPQLVQDSHTVNGTYTILGLQTDEERADFLGGLSAVSGLPEEQLQEKGSGQVTDSAFMRDILLLLLGTQVFLNLVFFLVCAVKNLPKQGKLALLGWSRSAFAAKVLGGFLLSAVAAVPILILLGWLLSGWAPSLRLFSYFLVVSVGNMAVVGVELMISAIVILMTKSLDAIRGRIPKRPLYVLGILAYLGVSIGIVFCGSYVDQPLDYLSENARLSRQWKAVSDYQILGSLSIGEDGDSFTGQSRQLDQDVYDWYRSIAGEEGVYLVGTSYYDDEVLSLWKDNKTYTKVPERPFWYFTLSPNYLEKLGIKADEQLLAGAQSGERLYLLPDTLSEGERSQLAAWLEESASRGIRSGDIQTQFTQSKQFRFATYTPKQELFTWATDSDSDMTASAPVIYVSTPENMRYFETESLRATGLDSYIKFSDETVMEKYTNESILERYHLSDNEMTFTAVAKYIDGLQKSIWQTILWFGLVFVILVIILVGLLLTLAAIFRIANQEKINVKKFLGFGFWQLYRWPVLLLSGLIAAELGIMLLLHSRFGLLLIVVVACLQLLIFTKYMARNELKRLLIALKGE